jgi:hypothetical protein
MNDPLRFYTMELQLETMNKIITAAIRRTR